MAEPTRHAVMPAGKKNADQPARRIGRIVEADVLSGIELQTGNLGSRQEPVVFLRCRLWRACNTVAGNSASASEATTTAHQTRRARHTNMQAVEIGFPTAMETVLRRSEPDRKQLIQFLLDVRRCFESLYNSPAGLFQHPSSPCMPELREPGQNFAEVET